MRRPTALIALFTTLAVPASSAMAQDDYVDLDGDDSRKSSRRASRQAATTEVVREITRGYFMKANAGTTIFLGGRSQILNPGTTLSLSFGGDALDKDKVSAGWEFIINQSIHNGLPFQDQGDLLLNGQISPNQLVQGDIHNVGFLLAGEASYYPVRRFGIGGRLGAGITLVPLLMDSFYYDTEVVGTAQGEGAWGGPANQPGVHQGVKPTFFGGLTMEYYTKLSHFSIGVDVDFTYILGLDFGLVPTGYFKYTF